MIQLRPIAADMQGMGSAAWRPLSDKSRSMPMTSAAFALCSRRMRLVLTAVLAAATAVSAPAREGDAPPQDVEVLHWWTSVGEATALDSVRFELARRSFQWKDSSVAGGDDRKLLIAKARMGAGQLPDAMQLHAFSLREAAPQARFLSFDALAAQGHWDDVVPEQIRRSAKVNGQWHAVPLNIHRSNWVWANRAIFEELGLAVPTTVAEFLAVAERVRAAGYIPLAHGAEPWQHALLFDNAVLSVGGPALYRKALIERDAAALASPKIVAAFEQMRQLTRLTDAHTAGRPWNFATAMVAQKKAAMQVMGDWAKGEFSKRGQQAGRDFLCFPYPGTAGSFVLVADLFAMPDVGAARREGQLALARSLMDPATQQAFNLAKGSIPARTDVPLDGFDECARQSARDLQAAARHNAVLSRYVAEFAEPVRNAVLAVVTEFVDSDQPAAVAAQRLRQAMALPPAKR